MIRLQKPSTRSQRPCQSSKQLIPTKLTLRSLVWSPTQTPSSLNRLSVSANTSKSSRITLVAVAYLCLVWRSPADSSLDVAEPFLRFSTTGELNGSATAILPNKTSVYMSFRAPVTETIFQNIVPGSDLERLEAVSAYLSVNIRSYKDGYGSSIGWEYNGTRRIVLGGWATLTASDEWLAGVDNVTATVYGVLDTTIVNMDPLYKPLVEID
ncbi:hypothetical protein PM082_007262 [Marasmius tenuissimus]|nr:hypothetical protein PM082_007262 [Marasmius tenuissimus]